jgi:hypothetical protein
MSSSLMAVSNATMTTEAGFWQLLYFCACSLFCTPLLSAVDGFLKVCKGLFVAPSRRRAFIGV